MLSPIQKPKMEILGMSTLERNRQVIRAYVEAFNRCDVDKLRSLFTPDAIIQGVLGSAPIDAAIAVWRELHQAYGISLDIEEIVIEGDVAAARYSESGTFRKPFRGMEPTQKSYSIIAMEWFQLRDGLIAKPWGARDSAAINRQLGV